MNGIPVLSAEGDCIARAWENSLVALYQSGGELATEYDAPGDPPSKDATMLVTVHDPLSEPRIHMDLPGGFEDLEEYVMEVREGIKDHLVRDPTDPTDTRWEYTYQPASFRLRRAGPAADRPDRADGRPGGQVAAHASGAGDHLEGLGRQRLLRPGLPPEPLVPDHAGRGEQVLSMNVRFRSNDAYKAALMNIFALVRLQEQIAERISELSGETVRVGRYCHLADSYHIYGKDLAEFKARFLGAIEKRTFDQRTVRYDDVRPIMEEARPRILEKVAKMARDAKG